MIELPLIAMTGLLGSSHCLGMCGPFALALGSASRGWNNALRRQIVYTLGRTFTYTFLGAVAGFAGLRLAHSVPALIHTASVLSIAAGALLMFQGLVTAGVIPSGLTGRVVALVRYRRSRSRSLAVIEPAPASLSCLAAPMFASLLGDGGWLKVFLAGLGTGLLPCGLLYGMVALAASSGGLWRGSLIMLVFGLGTAPAMIVLGVGGRALTGTGRLRLLRAAAWCLVLTGAVAILRGSGALHAAHVAAAPSCPFCHESGDQIEHENGLSD